VAVLGTGNDNAIIELSDDEDDGDLFSNPSAPDTIEFFTDLLEDMYKSFETDEESDDDDDELSNDYSPEVGACGVGVTAILELSLLDPEEPIEPQVTDPIVEPEAGSKKKKKKKKKTSVSPSIRDWKIELVKLITASF
jgi:hypothetical protein